jgi:hypothetical protein
MQADAFCATRIEEAWNAFREASRFDRVVEFGSKRQDRWLDHAPP